MKQQRKTRRRVDTMKPWKTITLMILMLTALQWAWPNFVHEPLHLVALYAQGSAGTITFDFTFPAHPSITRSEDLAGLPGALLFYLLPSLVSLMILTILWLTRKSGNLWTHFILPAYIGFDIVVNILTYKNPVSDFRILMFAPSWLPMVLIILITIATLLIFTSVAHKISKAFGADV